MPYSANYRLFLGASALLFLANLLVFNDVITFWDGAETAMAGRALLPGAGAPYFPDVLLRVLGGAGEPSAFLLRLPAVFGLLLSFAGFYWLGRPVYGRDAALHTLLLLGASFLIPFTGKLVTGDVWLLGAHLLGYQSLVLYLKQPSARRRGLFYGALLLGAWIHPLSTLIFLPGVATVFYFLHPQGKRLFGLNPWLAALVVGFALYFAGWLEADRSGFLLGFSDLSFGRYLLALALGLLPFTGFWLAGLWDAFQKLRQGEELSQLTFAWLIMAVIAQSPAAEAALAFLAAKQLLFYFDERYPYRDIVRTGAVLHLIGIFFAIMLMLLAGFLEFRGAGFRSGMSFGAVYWILSFAGVIGLFGMTRRLVVGGTVMSGLVGMLFFWLLLYPLWEGKRDLPKRIVAQVTVPAGGELVLAKARPEAPDNVTLYLRAAFPDLKLIATEEALTEAAAAGRGRWFVIEDTLAAGLTIEWPEADTLYGWDDRLSEEYYLIWKSDR